MIVITANGEVQAHEEATIYVKELDIVLTMKVLENTPAVLSLGKLCDENGNSYEWINNQNHISLKTGFGYNVTRRTSFRSWFQASRQEPNHPTSSSSSSTSPTTTVLSDSETRTREDLSGIDSHTVTVSSKHVERKER